MVPFLDLVAFTHLNDAPAERRAGPDHYYTFQLTYMVHHVAARVLSASGLDGFAQAKFFYLLQVLLTYAGLSILLCHWAGWRFAIFCLPVLVLSEYDGLFLWGGPLAFSLMGLTIFLAGAAVFALPERLSSRRPLSFVFLPLVAVAAHPFGIPLCALFLASFFLVPAASRDRPWCIIGALAVAGYGLVIARDSAGVGQAVSASAYLGIQVTAAQIIARAEEFFTHDRELAATFVNESGRGLDRLIEFLVGLKMVGFVYSAFALLRALVARVSGRESRAHVAATVPLHTLNLVFLLYYLVAPDPHGVSTWPQRILSVGKPFSVLCGLLACHAVVEWSAEQWRRVRLARWSGWRWLGWLAVAGYLAGALQFLLPLQEQVFANGEVLLRERNRLKAAIVPAHAGDIVRFTGLDYLKPLWLRAVPFMLFDDPDVVAQGTLVATEWHFHPQHNAKIPFDSLLGSGRRETTLEFLPSAIVGQLAFQITSGSVYARYKDRLGEPIEVRLAWDDDSACLAEPILTTGGPQAGDFIFLDHKDGMVRVSMNHWGGAKVTGCEFHIESKQSYDFKIWLGNIQFRGDPTLRNLALVLVNDIPCLETFSPLFATTTEQIRFGRNEIGGQAAEAQSCASKVEIIRGAPTAPGG